MNRFTTNLNTFQRVLQGDESPYYQRATFENIRQGDESPYYEHTAFIRR